MGDEGDLILVFADALARGWKQIVNFDADDAGPATLTPRPARAVPKETVEEEAPADDAQPAKPAALHHLPLPLWSSKSEDRVLVRDARGVVLAREAND